MKRTIGSISVIIVVLFTMNTAFSQSSQEFRAKIESLNKEMVKNMVDGNIEKLLGMFTEDAITMPNYQPMMEGIAAIRKSSEEMSKNGLKYNSFAPTTLKVIVNGNQITEIGTFKINLILPHTTTPIDDHGKYLNIWEIQKDGSLKIKYQIWNTDVNPIILNTSSGEAKK